MFKWLPWGSHNIKREMHMLSARDKMQSLILEIVESDAPIKATALIAKLSGSINRNATYEMRKTLFTMFDEVPKMLTNLVQQRRIVEVEYSLPSMPYRAKSVYFPAGTKIKP